MNSFPHLRDLWRSTIAVNVFNAVNAVKEISSTKWKIEVNLHFPSNPLFLISRPEK